MGGRLSSVPPTPLTGVVLAGGRGRRFGGDKLAARLGSATVLEHSVGTLATICDPVFVVGGTGSVGVPAPGRWLADAVPAGCVGGCGSATPGPLAGLVAGLEHARTTLVAVVAGDLPFPSTEVFTQLAAQWDGEPAVIPRVGGVPQPLHAVWATTHRAAVRAAFDRGRRSPLSVAEVLGARFVDPPQEHAGLDDPPLWVSDVDRPEDLERLRSRQAAHGPDAGADPRDARGPTR
jgi:molybdenum cofactor guanylyltransferase